MTRLIASFARDTAGAVTVDWITLTAAVVVLAISGVSAAEHGVVELGSRLTEGVSVHDSTAD